MDQLSTSNDSSSHLGYYTAWKWEIWGTTEVMNNVCQCVRDGFFTFSPLTCRGGTLCGLRGSLALTTGLNEDPFSQISPTFKCMKEQKGGHRSQYDLESSGSPRRCDNLILIQDRTKFMLLALEISGMWCETHTKTTLYKKEFMQFIKRILYQKKKKKS